MTQQGVDILDQARTMVGDAGTVRSKYGGLEVEIHDGAAFPWNDFMQRLCTVGQDVWVTATNGTLVIHTKPPAI